MKEVLLLRIRKLLSSPRSEITQREVSKVGESGAERPHQCLSLQRQELIKYLCSKQQCNYHQTPKYTMAAIKHNSASVSVNPAKG